MSRETDDGTAGGLRRAVGSPVRRREDGPLITGQAEYTDDHSAPGMVHAALVRSQYGHARIVEIDTAEAEAVEGVLGVFTAEDVAASGAPGHVPAEVFPPSGPGTPFDLRSEVREPRRPILAEERVRYTGEAVAVVVAEDKYTAHDAVNRVEVEYERLEAVTDPSGAVSQESPQLHDDAPENVALAWSVGDEAAVDAAFDDATHVVQLDLENQRLAPNAIENRSALAEYRSASGELRVTLSSQVPHQHRGMLAGTLGLPENKVRVVAPDVGGGFGLKSKYHQGEAVTAWCSMQLGRPVKWQAGRTESFASDIHGRGHLTHGAIALDDDGTFLGLRVDTQVDVGAYTSKVAPFIATGAYARLLSGQYAIPAIHCDVTAAFTNKSPMDAYRGAGRPEAAYILERLVQRAATELDVDPAELRRRNFVPPDDFPYETPLGATYDSGNYEAALDHAIDVIDYEAFRERRAELRGEGRYLGIGFGCFIESAGVNAPESALVRFHPSGTVTAYTGTHDHGQGHGTTFAQVVADELGVDYDDVEIREGDTEAIPKGTGTYGSRSAAAAGTALVESAAKVVENARRMAAHELEAAAEDVVFENGEFHVTGAPDRSIGIQDVARRIYSEPDLPEGVEPGLEATSFTRTDQTFPFGTHVAVVEVDPETGEVDLRRFVAVDDCGVRINPMIVEGQLHGGIAQGIGQALYEGVRYDENATLLTGSMQDYALPRAESLPDLEMDETVTPSPRNPLGVKGVGESGTIGSPPAVVNAVVDALEPFDVEHIDMPLTPETVWRAIRDGN